MAPGGALVSRVDQGEDFLGEAGMDDAVRPGSGQVTRPSRCHPGELQRESVGLDNDLHIHSVLGVLHRVAWFSHFDPLDEYQRALHDN